MPASAAPEPPPLAIADFVVCHEDVKKAEEIAKEKIIGYLMSVLDHYEMLDKSHFAETGQSYQHYANAADQMKEMGMEAMCEAFLEANLWGDPAMIRDKMEQRREIIGGDLERDVGGGSAERVGVRHRQEVVERNDRRDALDHAPAS